MAIETLPALTQVRMAGLRTRLVSRLTGLSASRIRYWGERGLLDSGPQNRGPGTPRLYNWVDYLRLRLAASLDAEGMPAGRVCEAIRLLDERSGEWWDVADPLAAGARGRLAADGPDAAPNGGGPFALDWPDDCRDLGAATERALTEIGARGSLDELSRFRDAVYMSPRMNLAQPTVANTALETQFVVGMAADMGADAFAETFRIERRMIERARQFEDAIR